MDADITDTQAQFTRFERTKYFPALDGLRAFCVFAVFFAHMHERLPPRVYGWLGVDVFFVLSGFLITTLMVRERQRSNQISLKAFYVRRFFRIVPVYFFAIVLYAAAVFAVHDPVKRHEFRVALPWLLSFLQEYRPAAAGNVLGHSWTLGIEEKFYALWPLLVVLCYPFRNSRVVVLGGVFAVAIISPPIYRRSYGAILLGAFLGLALSVPSLQSLVVRIPKVPNIVLWALFTFGYLVAGYDGQLSLIFAGAAACIIASLVLRNTLSQRFLSHNVLVYIGRRSYAIYLIHVLAIDTVETCLTRLLPNTWTRNWIEVIGLAFSMSLMGAALIHTCIEQPSIRFGKLISDRLAGSKPFASTLSNSN